MSNPDGCQRDIDHGYCKLCCTYLHCTPDLDQPLQFIRRDTGAEAPSQLLPLFTQIREILHELDNPAEPA